MDKEFDLICIGGGSGGIACVNAASKLGAKCLIIEQDYLGGTCVNRGCVPKKLMYTAAGFTQTSKLAQDFGFHHELGAPQWSKLVASRETYLRHLNDIYAKGLATNGATHITGKASLIDKHKVCVNKQTYHGKYILIATGSHPRRHTIPGDHCAIDSDGFFKLNEQPQKVAIIGGGYIAVELASMLSALGTEVHLLYRGTCLLRGFDAMLQEALAASLQAHGVHLYPEHEVCAIDKKNKCRLKTLQNVELSDLDCIITAIGRVPQTQGLNLMDIGVDLDDRDFIQVNAHMQTSIDNIYAVGDVTAYPALTPVAIRAGRLLAAHLFADSNKTLDTTFVPSVIFTHPPIGTIGYSEAKARELFDTVNTYKTQFTPLHYAFTEQKPLTHMKLITQGKEELVVGCHIMGDNADEMLQGFSVAITQGITLEQWRKTLPIHPTAAEELVTL